MPPLPALPCLHRFHHLHRFFVLVTSFYRFWILPTLDSSTRHRFYHKGSRQGDTYHLDTTTTTTTYRRTPPPTATTCLHLVHLPPGLVLRFWFTTLPGSQLVPSAPPGHTYHLQAPTYLDYLAPPTTCLPHCLQAPGQLPLRSTGMHWPTAWVPYLQDYLPFLPFPTTCHTVSTWVPDQLVMGATRPTTDHSTVPFPTGQPGRRATTYDGRALTTTTASPLGAYHWTPRQATTYYSSYHRPRFHHVPLNAWSFLYQFIPGNALLPLPCLRPWQNAL